MTTIRRLKTILCTVAIGMGACALSSTLDAAPPEFLQSAERIVFLGDSITHAGHYIGQLEAQWRLQHAGLAPEMINLGLPSETCSGLSEPDHPFPRPDVHERLRRALDATEPDVVVACYGMNDGIYYPFDEQRFKAYREGIMRLIVMVKSTGAKLILMSPPAFDPLPLRKQNQLRPLGAEKYAWFAIYEGYDDVMSRYTDWIMDQRDRLDMVIDLHKPMNDFLAEKRSSEADFTLSTDGVHVNTEGHKILSNAILNAWEWGPPLPVPPDMTESIAQRQTLLRDAWLSHVGHKRPDVKAGLPLEQAQRQAAQIEAAMISAFGS